MKLIDLLVKKTNEEGLEWPAEASAAIAIKDGSDYVFYRSGELLVNCNIHWIKGSGKYDVWVKKQSPFLDSLWGKKSDVVLKSQYESALAASEGWIEWGGGECPVEYGTMVDIRDGDGYEWYGVKATPAREYSDACGTFWEHKGSPENNIISYRLHKPDLNSRANDDRLEQDLNECIGQGVGMPEWNGDGLPPVGYECETIHRSCDSWQPIKVIAVNDGAVFGFWVSGNTPCALPVEVYQFRPLRTEAERARDAAVVEMCFRLGIDRIKAEKCYDIASNKIRGAKLEVK